MPGTPVARQRSAAGIDVAVRARPGGARSVDRGPPQGAAVPHAVMLRGLGSERGRGPAAPTLIERREEDFVSALEQQLEGEGGVQAVIDAARALLARRRPAGAPLTLFPPVQRVQHLVLVEACCAEPGYPRLDPRRIAGAGLVVRRIDGAARLAWTRAGRRAVGWQKLQASTAALARHEDDDPDPAQRAPRLSAGHRWIDERLGANRAVAGRAAAAERSLPLHPLPPAICDALGRTLLFGWLPVGSDEVADDDAPSGALPPVDDADIAALQQHLSPWLNAGGLRTVPRAGEAIDVAWVDLDAAAHAPLEPLVTMLLQLRNEFDAFGDSAESRALASALQGLRVLEVSADAKAAVGASRVAALVARCLAIDPALKQPAALDNAARLSLAAIVQPAFPYTALPAVDRFLRGSRLRSAQPFLRDAATALVDETAAPVHLPDFWLPVEAATARAIAAACAASAVARFDRLFSAGRAYSEPGQRYAVRCFVRVARADGCPPELVWSGYGEPFTVAPWWVASGVKPRVIPLPDPFDRALLRQLQPGVAFGMPASLAKLLTRRNLKRIEDGEKPPAGGLDIAWVCGFNIPIITLCAMIVLHIFLQLLNIVFWWLPFIKVCIPLPRAKP